MKKYKLTLFIFPLLLFLLLCGSPAVKTKAEEVTGEASHKFTYPNDPYIDALWSFDNPGTYTHYYGSFPVTQRATADIDMNIWDAWKNYPVSKEDTRTVIIAIIDTGIDYRHPDLKDQMWINPNEIPDNGIDDDGNGYIDDIHGWDFYNNDASICHYSETENGYTTNPDDNDNHGTHIAGIIAATANNSLGLAGVASNVNIKIMSLKIHGGSTSSGSVSNAIKAIRYAESMGADICNLSWGTTNYSQALELTIRESSMLFVTAAGNNGINNNSTPVFPASLRLPNLISVAYVDSDGQLDAFSNYGVSTVDLAAPGKDIYSTLVGSYGYSSGSSMAAPHVTALAAMIYAYRESMYPSQVKELIINTMLPLDTLNGYLINPGIPDANAAICALPQLQHDTEAPFLVLETTYEREQLSVLVEAYDVGDSGIRKVHYVYGSKPADFFFTDNGSTAILENRVLLAKAGYYTFYVEDYAGNYSVHNYYVEDDTMAPDFTSSYFVSEDYSYISVLFTVFDSDSGVKSIKYLPGEHDKNAFLLSGTVLDPSREQQNIYLAPDVESLTIYLADYRGNSAAYIISTKIVPAAILHLNLTERALGISETFQLQPLIFPWFSTDGVSYTSSDESVVTVSAKGLVTAAGFGEAQVQVTTHSGISATCRFVIPEPVSAAEPEPATEPESMTEPESTGEPEPAAEPDPAVEPEASSTVISE